ncbi:hypothetical protein BCR33DRAFT_711933 [Rhizoclosmatium globosum]|uniref:Uncharacterized protein n=1 Tax=Rhizoclosmatium globosum TaxID=329046 RepID=A0A1Y2D0F5_9FUNG|nr:hypothetical protein BCR33DRAFT_711933 [Rhizoclosmatium globosum]|eukprot:ORY52687.1 hypothetical protein BCR33DRAFT_711933 [Rhizoclosmatium globosum]
MIQAVVGTSRFSQLKRGVETHTKLALFVFLSLTLLRFRTSLIHFWNRRIQYALVPQQLPRCLPHQPSPSSTSSLSHVVTFAAARAAGLESENFSLEANRDDTRLGVAKDAADELQRLMDHHNCGFDEARLLLVKKQMRENGVDPDTGLPLDPKALVFSSRS